MYKDLWSNGREVKIISGLLGSFNVNINSIGDDQSIYDNNLEDIISQIWYNSGIMLELFTIDL